MAAAFCGKAAGYNQLIVTDGQDAIAILIRTVSGAKLTHMHSLLLLAAP